MMELVISFQKDDAELVAALEDFFGDKIAYEESKNFDGLDFFLTVVIPVSSLSIQLVDFILSYFNNKETKGPAKGKQRVIISPNGSIDLRGYSEKEARKIINCYFENQRK